MDEDTVKYAKGDPNSFHLRRVKEVCLMNRIMAVMAKFPVIMEYCACSFHRER